MKAFSLSSFIPIFFALLCQSCSEPTLRVAKKKIDVLWIVDNSASMFQEAPRVRDHLDSFIQSATHSTNMNMVLLSATEATSSEGVTLSESAKSLGAIQIEQTITSNSPLQDILDNQTEILSHFRSGVAKAIVIVTDDESSVTTSSFLSQLDPDLSTNLKVYGLITFDWSESPCQIREGAIYQELAQQSHGAVYNICDSDWTSHISDLAYRIRN